MTQNPLLTESPHPFAAVPFDRLKEEHFLPALKEAIAKAKQKIKELEEDSSPPNFANTLVPLDYLGLEVERISSTFFNLNSAETNAEIQAIAKEFSPLLTAFGNDILLNDALFARIEQVWQQGEQEDLNPEQQRLLEKTYRAFMRNGARLDAAGKEKLRTIDAELSGLSLQFGENLLAATNAYQLFLVETDLEGLPDWAKQAAADEAEAAGRPGEFLITLQMPSYLPFMMYADRRDLREKLHRAYGSKAFADQFDNRDVVLQIARLRFQRAQLLGFATHADFVLQERMAEQPQKVMDFLEDLASQARPAAERELQELSAFAQSRDGLDQLQAWDMAYYTEKRKQERFAIDDDKLKPYFPLAQTLNGAFAVAEKLYGLRFALREDLPVYHPEVEVYEVLNAHGHHQALFYADFFPRKGKRNGAWMTTFREQYRQDGRTYRPQVSIVCNFSKPGKDRPSLLTFQEVLTLFHEFGHALHAILAESEYPSLSGTNVYWDFVELPSQIMENWCYEKECLDLFARHYASGEDLPAGWVDKLKASAQFMEGQATLRQVSLATLDMAWHDADPTEIESVESLEEAAVEKFRLLPRVEGNNMSCQFGHLFQGAYAAGYYSYKWAEVLDADAFERFREKGIFDPETAEGFRKLLAAGGTEHPAVLFRRFRGKDPDPAALLRRAGLLAK